jgi:hypothetical protein
MSGGGSSGGGEENLEILRSMFPDHAEEQLSRALDITGSVETAIQRLLDGPVEVDQDQARTCEPSCTRMLHRVVRLAGTRPPDVPDVRRRPPPQVRRYAELPAPHVAPRSDLGNWRRTLPPYAKQSGAKVRYEELASQHEVCPRRCDSRVFCRPHMPSRSRVTLRARSRQRGRPTPNPNHLTTAAGSTSPMISPTTRRSTRPSCAPSMTSSSGKPRTPVGQPGVVVLAARGRREGGCLARCIAPSSRALRVGARWSTPHASSTARGATRAPRLRVRTTACSRSWTPRSNSKMSAACIGLYRASMSRVELRACPIVVPRSN